MSETEIPQSNFESWAVVELLGHRKEIGFVTTQAFGPAVLFRVDVPELPARDYTLESPEYVDGRYCPIGTKVQRPASPGRSCLVAPASLYAINPCSEEAAMKVIERSVARPLIILELPEQTALPAHDLDDEFNDGDNGPED